MFGISYSPWIKKVCCCFQIPINKITLYLMQKFCKLNEIVIVYFILFFQSNKFFWKSTETYLQYCFGIDKVCWRYILFGNMLEETNHSQCFWGVLMFRLVSPCLTNLVCDVFACKSDWPGWLWQRTCHKISVVTTVFKYCIEIWLSESPKLQFYVCTIEQTSLYKLWWLTSL